MTSFRRLIWVVRVPLSRSIGALRGPVRRSLSPKGRRTTQTTNQHFYSQLAQRIMKVVTHPGPFGKLYDMDPRLRPTGKSGALACSLGELKRYFAEGHGALWERPSRLELWDVSSGL